METLLLKPDPFVLPGEDEPPAAADLQGERATAAPPLRGWLGWC